MKTELSEIIKKYYPSGSPVFKNWADSYRKIACSNDALKMCMRASGDMRLPDYREVDIISSAYFSELAAQAQRGEIEQVSSFIDGDVAIEIVEVELGMMTGSISRGDLLHPASR